MAKRDGTAVSGKPKKVCPLSADEFLAVAKPLSVKVEGQTIMATPKVFSSGSFGWYGTGKIVVEVGDTPVQVQVSMPLTAIGSKPE